MDDNTAAVSVLVPLFGMVCVFVVPVAAFIFFRVLAHRERMEMIRQGIVPPIKGAARGAQASRVSQQPGEADRSGPGMPPDVALAKGIRLAFIGLAITIGLSFIGYHHGSTHLGPWLLGGLIPLFIGLSQIVIAVLSGAQLGSQRGFGPTFGVAPPPSADEYREPQAPFEGPYTYRPGSTQELRRPTPPPERRQ